MEEALTAFQPDLCFITTGMTYWYPGVRETVEMIRRLFPGVPILAGGVYAGLLKDHCLAVCGVDEVFAPVEQPPPGALPQGKDAAGSDPVFEALGAWLKARGFPFPLHPSPDSAPLTGVEEGCAKGTAALWGEAGVIRLNRGCPLHCAYCAGRRLNGGFEAGDPEAAWASLEELERGGLKNFAFYDDALLYRQEEILIPFLEKVLAAGRRFHFYTPNGLHIRGLTAETAALMHRAGFEEIRFGFESSSADFHQSYDGKWADDDFAHAVENCLAAGFAAQQLRTYILAGLPGQKAAEVEASLRCVKRRGLAVSLAEFSPVPGSPLWRQCVEQSPLPLEEEPLYQNNCFFPMESADFTAEDLVRLKIFAREK
jgi:hypothetical protein